MVVFGRNVRGVGRTECVRKHVVFDGTLQVCHIECHVTHHINQPPHPQEKQAMQAALLEVITPEELPL